MMMYALTLLYFNHSSAFTDPQRIMYQISAEFHPPQLSYFTGAPTTHTGEWAELH